MKGKIAIVAAISALAGFGVLALTQRTYAAPAQPAWIGRVCPAGAVNCTPGPVVTVRVSASGGTGDVLHYRWRATDGAILDQDSSWTTWKLPPGHGLHFAYVLVSNGKGGYTERRLVLSTDDIGTSVPAGGSGNAYLAPAAPAVTTDTFRLANGFGGSNTLDSGSADLTGITGFPYRPLHDAKATDLPVYLAGSSYLSATVQTDLRGEFLITGIPQDVFGLVHVFANGADDGTLFTENSQMPDQPPVSATSEYVCCAGVVPYSLVGSLFQADGSTCGTVNRFFDVVSTGTAERTDQGMLTGPVRINSFGDFVLPDPTQTGLGTATLRCENATPVNVSVTSVQSGAFPMGVLRTVPPTVSGMSASLASQPVGAFLPPPSGLPSDLEYPSDHFLTRKGIDDRQSACRYYAAIGAAAGCDGQGNLIGGINFDDWKRATHMAPYTRGGYREATATFVNKMDLNLTRRHHAISYQHGSSIETAAYVCNHKGPGFDDAQGDVDAVIASAAAGRDEIACVAMDYAVTPGVNGGKPFTRFIIFGPSGEILPSINLDGRGEKFMPGACVACHGGSNYAGHFADGAAALPDIGGHFLPYDAGNFLYSSKAGLRAQDQESAIKALNLIVLKGTGPTQAEINLINGWYAPNLSATTLDRNYFPPTWAALDSGDLNGTNHQAYRKIFAPMCRTCHAAMPDLYDFDAPNKMLSDVPHLIVSSRVCDTVNYADRRFSMPNSLVTFNRFWITAGASNPADDLPLLYAQFLAANYDTGVTCTLAAP